MACELELKQFNEVLAGFHISLQQTERENKKEQKRGKKGREQRKKRRGKGSFREEDMLILYNLFFWL